MRRVSLRRWTAMMMALVISSFAWGAVAVADTAEGPKPVEVTLEHLSDILKQIEGELSALQAPRAEHMEEGLEQVIELIAGILETFDRPRDETAAAFKARVVRMDLMLHQFVDVLEQFLDAKAPPASTANLRDALGELGAWVDGYVDGLTTGMDPGKAERLEQAIHSMVRDLAKELAGLAARTSSEQADHPRLERLLEQLNDLVARLDRFILQSSRRPDPEDDPS